jgi:hypothetical protein
MLREHHTAQVKARMLAGEAWQDNDEARRRVRPRPERHRQVVMLAGAVSGYTHAE